MQVAIDQHHHCVDGKRYQFKVVWAALEPRWSARSNRYLLAIEVLSQDQVGSSRIHFVAQARTNREDLLRLVDEALELQVRESPDGAAVHTPEMLRA
jgi:hypothetical protein